MKTLFVLCSLLVTTLALAKEDPRQAKIKKCLAGIKRHSETADKCLAELVQMKATEANPQLITILKTQAISGAPVFAEEIANAIDSIGPVNTAGLSFLLNDKSNRLRLFAAKALRTAKPDESLREVMKQIKTSTPDATNGTDFWREKAIDELVQRKEKKVLPELLQMLTTVDGEGQLGDHFIPQKIVDAVRSIGVQDLSQPISELIKNKSPWIRFYGAQLLFDLAPADASKELVQLWTETPASLNQYGVDKFHEELAYRLTQFRRPEFVPFYGTLVHGQNPAFQREAALALGRMKVRESADWLYPLLSSSEEIVQTAGLFSLENMGDATIAKKTVGVLSSIKVPLSAITSIKEDLSRLRSEASAPLPTATLLAQELSHANNDPKVTGKITLRRWLMVYDLVQATPEDEAVQKISEAKDLCEHWGGEEPYNKKRAHEIAAGAKRDCALFKKQAAEAQKKFPQNGELNELLKTSN